MAISPAAAPPGLAQAAMQEAASARDLRRPDGADRELMDLGGGERVEAAASDPLPIFSVPIEALADETVSRVEDAVHRGWRVRTADAEGEQLVDLAVDGEPLAVRRGQSSSILLSAARLAEDAADPEASYEARLLDFGQLGLSALWLHREDGPDRFFSLDREPRERGEDELLADASRRARRYLAQADGGADAADVPDLGG